MFELQAILIYVKMAFYIKKILFLSKSVGKVY